MRLAVDTNILFSILIGGRRLRILFLENRGRLELYTPGRMVREVERLLPKAAGHINAEPSLVREIYNTLVKPYVHIVEETGIPQAVMEEAKRLAAGVDPDDWPFVALAMFLGVPLWTGDKGLLRFSARTGYKNFIAIDTEGVELLLRGEPLDSVLERMRGKYLG